MKINKSIQIVTIFTILVIVIVGLTLFSLIRDIDKTQEEMIASQEIKDGVFELNLLIYDYLIFNKERAIEQWYSKYNSIKYLISNKYFEEKEEQVIFEQIRKDYDNLEIVFNGIVKINENSTNAGKGSALDDELKSTLSNQLIISSLNIVSGASRLSELSILQLRSTENKVISIFIFVFILIMVIFSINLFLFNRYFIDPLNRLYEDTKIIGSGDLDHKAGIELDNEIGDLSRAFDSMVDNLKKISTSRDELNREISKRKKAEEEFHLAFEQSGIGMAFYGLDGRWLKVNPELCKILGYSESELLKMDFQTITYPEDQELSLKYNDMLLNDFIKKYQLKKRYIRKDGGIIWVKITESLVRNPAGEPLYFISQIEDITKSEEAEKTIRNMNLELEEKIKERTLDIENSRVSLINLLDDVNEKSEELKRTTIELMISKERAEEADRLKSAFLATMSHELRTPLNSILGFTGILLQGFSGAVNEEQRKQLTMVNNSAKHLLSLIQDILDVSKIESGQLKINFINFDMHKTIEAAVRTVTPIANEKGLALHVAVTPEEIVIKSDQRRVEQIIFNLLSNAIKFTEKGEVRIECQVSDGQVITRVIDTGIGIKSEHMDRLFKPFIQLDDKLSRRYEGTGLGLSICKSLVELLGGEIFAQSEEGKGSVFTFILPIIEETT